MTSLDEIEFLLDNGEEIPEKPIGPDYEEFVLVRRVSGWGDAYLPQFSRSIKEGGLWYLPPEEAEARADWEVIGATPKQE